MKKEEILKFINAGFTKEEILLMEQEEGETAAAASGEKSLNGGPGEGDEARPETQGQDPGVSEDPNKDIKAWLKNMQDDINKQIAEIKAIQQQQNVKIFNTDDDGDERPTSTLDVYRGIYSEPEPLYDFNKGGEK